MSKHLLRLTCRSVVTIAALASANALAQGLDLTQALSETELAQTQGRAGLNVMQLSGANLSASLIGNSANDTVTGNNWIADGAFAGSNGFATIIQNTGNNVIIQDSLIVNVSVAQ